MLIGISENLNDILDGMQVVLVIESLGFPEVEASFEHAR